MKYGFHQFAGLAARVAGTMLLSAGVALSAHAQTRIIVGSTVSTDVSAAALALAMKDGSFKRAGLDVQLKNFVQSNQKYDTFKAGAIDVDINMGAINAAQLYSSGVPLQVLRAATPADIWAVVTPTASPLKVPADLKGKRYGVVSLSGTNYGATYAALKLVNVDLMRDVKVSTLPPSAILLALGKNDIDAATLYEPYLTPAIQSGRVKVMFKPDDLYRSHYKEPFLALVIAARKDFVTKNQAAAAKFVDVMEQAMARLADNTDAAATALTEVMPEIKLTPAQVKELLLPYIPNIIKTPNDPATIKIAQNLYDRMLEARQLRSPVKASEFWIKL
ncbi:ABC-type nitrate/sulfonate/bicarbonate transport system substrate-binding protein [Massilia sp. UYP11]|uniref:ABC transporter substrate-binding protein n=1 Tax=Massilia sp. UYP11 TaxID=1756385 RepID=UPI003D21F97B